MAETWRLLDTGLGSAARNIALSRALLEARAADETASTLRFARFSRCALVGSHQSAARELHLPECAAAQAAVQRRITGGAAWFVDERQLGWELYLHRRDVGAADMNAIAKRVAHAAAAGLSALGIDARYRPRDEIEVDGRTLCSLGHACESEAVLVQAVLLVDVDFERMTRVLRLPGELRGAGRIDAARARFAGLKEVLARSPDMGRVRANLTEAFESEFDVELRECDLNITEHSRIALALSETDTRGWVELDSRPGSDVRLAQAQRAVKGGVLRASIRLDSPERTIRQGWFEGEGEVGLAPRRGLLDLEAALRDLPVARLALQVESFFANGAVRCVGVEPKDFVSVVRLAAGEPLVA